MSKPLDQHEADDTGRPPSTADWVAAAGRAIISAMLPTMQKSRKAAPRPPSSNLPAAYCARQCRRFRGAFVFLGMRTRLAETRVAERPLCLGDHGGPTAVPNGQRDGMMV